MQLFSFSAVLLSIHFMVKHAETLWVIMSNGLWNEPHLNPDSKGHYPQTLIPNLCLASGEGDIVHSTHGTRLRMVKVLLCPFACSVPTPSATLAGAGMNVSLKNSLWGWWELPQVPRRRQGEPPSGESHTSALSSRCPLKHRQRWSHPHLQGWLEGIRN